LRLASIGLCVLCVVLLFSALAGAEVTKPKILTKPVVSGLAEVGQVLSVSNGTWEGSPTSFKYAWKACNEKATECVTIAGATSQTYEVPAMYLGHRLAAVVTATNSAGSTAAKSATTKVVAPGPPRDKSAPAITGSAVEGSTLSASEGSWAGTEPFTYAYRWQRCNGKGESCSNVAGATSATYAAGSQDVGNTLRVEVTATNSVGSEHAFSAPTAVVESAAPRNTAAPAVIGTTEEGWTLAASTGSWERAPTSYAYQWQTCNEAGAECQNVSGGTEADLELGASLIGRTLRVVVTATNEHGSTQATSAPSSVVRPVPGRVAIATDSTNGPFLAYIDRNGNLWGEQGLSGQWILLLNGGGVTSVSIATDPTHGLVLAAVENGAVFAKEGGLTSGWVTEFSSGASQVSVASDPTYGPVLAVIDGGNFYAQQGGLTTAWDLELNGGGITSVAAATDPTHGPLLAAVDNGAVFAKEGGLSSGWVTEFTGGASQVSAASDPAYGPVLGVIDGADFLAQQGSLTSAWALELNAGGITSVSVATDPTHGPLLAAVENGVVFAKEGGLGAAWTTQTSGATRVSVASDASHGPYLTWLSAGQEMWAVQGMAGSPQVEQQSTYRWESSCFNAVEKCWATNTTPEAGEYGSQSRDDDVNKLPTLNESGLSYGSGALQYAQNEWTPGVGLPPTGGDYGWGGGNAEHESECNPNPHPGTACNWSPSKFVTQHYTDEQGVWHFAMGGVGRCESAGSQVCNFGHEMLPYDCVYPGYSEKCVYTTFQDTPFSVKFPNDAYFEMSANLDVTQISATGGWHAFLCAVLQDTKTGVYLQVCDQPWNQGGFKEGLGFNSPCINNGTIVWQNPGESSPYMTTSGAAVSAQTGSWIHEGWSMSRGQFAALIRGEHEHCNTPTDEYRLEDWKLRLSEDGIEMTAAGAYNASIEWESSEETMVTHY
jgi:hypothetical protein